MNRVCNACLQEKSITEFDKQGSGFRKTCKDCISKGNPPKPPERGKCTPNKPKTCRGCGKEYWATSSNQRFCFECKGDNERRVARENTKRRREKLGYHYNQSGANNNNWKGGIGTYQKYLKSECERCGSTERLLVHHKDRDRYNNTEENLETLCKSCHQAEHCVRDAAGRFISKKG